jgi:mannose-6-phosphate isomerase
MRSLAGGRLVNSREFELYPLSFEPLLKERVWGSDRLASLGKRLPGAAPYGESWELVDLPAEQSRVAGGPLAGVTLREIVERTPAALLGPVALDAGSFPLLVKYIDAAETLSVQVHPGVASAARLGGRAKSEAWYILDAKPGATIHVGLRPGTTRGELEAALASDRVAELLRVRPVRAGDVIPVAPGTVHAIGAGVLLAEVQQPSDTTYRVHDWGRSGLDGKPRALHVREALECIRFDAEVPELRAPVALDLGPFKLEVVGVDPGLELDLAGEGPLVVVGLEGAARLEGAWPAAGAELGCRRGRTLLVPHCCRDGRIVAAADALLLLASFPRADHKP